MKRTDVWHFRGNIRAQLMKSKGYFANREIFAENYSVVNQQSSIQTPPEFGLNSLKG
jgi:hypothetical protein